MFRPTWDTYNCRLGYIRSQAGHTGWAGAGLSLGTQAGLSLGTQAELRLGTQAGLGLGLGGGRVGRPHLLGGGDDALGDDVALHDATEDIHEDGLAYVHIH